MPSVTIVVIVVGLAASALATLMLLWTLQPAISGRLLGPVLGTAAGSGAVTVLLGLGTGAAQLPYLVGISGFAVPVLVLLELASLASGVGSSMRVVVLIVWGVVVFPVSALVPLLVTAGCAGTACELEDFGGALPLLVSSSAFLLLPGVSTRARLPSASGGLRGVLAGILFWLAFVVWLAQQEGAFDAYVPRILLAGVIGPASAALGWLLVDRLRRIPRATARSIALGALAGMAATVPGAVTVGFPWSAIVGVLAGVIGAAIAARRGSRVTSVSRWAVVALVVTVIGFLAPAISGDTIGILFAAQIDVLRIAVLALVGVTAFSVLVSVPIWLPLRIRGRGR